MRKCASSPSLQSLMLHSRIAKEKSCLYNRSMVDILCFRMRLEVGSVERDKTASERGSFDASLRVDIHKYGYGMRLKEDVGEYEKKVSERGCFYQSLMFDIQHHCYGMRSKEDVAESDKKVRCMIFISIIIECV